MIAAPLPAVADPARRQHRQRRHRVDHLRPEHDAAHVTGVAAALAALRDHEVDAGRLVRERVLDASAQRADQPAGGLDVLDHVGGRGAQRVGDHLDLRVLQDHLDLRSRGGRGPAEQLARLLALGQLGHAVLGEQPLREGAVLGRDHLAQLLLERGGVEVLALPGVLAGDHDVDAIRLIADVVVDPFELDLELLGGEADGAEHAEAARLADGDHHVAAVREGEDRELDAETLAKLVSYSLLGWRAYPESANVPVLPDGRP
jgi:hypothetical protein